MRERSRCEPSPERTRVILCSLFVVALIVILLIVRALKKRS